MIREAFEAFPTGGISMGWRGQRAALFFCTSAIFSWACNLQRLNLPRGRKLPLLSEILAFCSAGATKPRPTWPIARPIRTSGTNDDFFLAICPHLSYSNRTFVQSP